MWTERESCLLVLDSVTSTPQWIHQPKPRGDYDGEKRNVLIISMLLLIIIDLALRSKTHERIEVLRVRGHSNLEGPDGFSCRRFHA
jgi:hypothetical protein